MKCKLCNKHLYKNLDIRSIFQTKQIHIECEELLQRRSSTEVIPITNNVIHFEYFFTKKQDINYDFLFRFIIIHALNKYMNDDSWSVIFMYEEEEYISLSDESKYLLLHLGQKPIVFISMFAY